MKLAGLTDKEVAEKVRKGRVNRAPGKAKNSVSKIVLRNTFTVFNIVNLILATMVLLVGSYKNLLFIIIAIANTLISIINEIRAKRTIDKMRLIAEQRPTVIRNGQTRQIPQDQIVDGDLMILSLGDQILVDSRVEEGTIEVNESFITGESSNITKHPGDQLVSGSFVVSGACKATATAVGAENYIRKLESSAHTIKTANSKLFTLMNNIVKYISYALIPIGALLLWARFRVPGTTTETAVTSTVAALINMIPEGLILLTSSVLALAAIRLSRKKVLVQDLYSVETLARVDCICLDKTGTLTAGKMHLVDIIPAEGQSKNSLETALMAILSASTADTATSAALKAKLLKTAKSREIDNNAEEIPFSSDRKYSGVRTGGTTYLMGAPEFLIEDKNTLEQIKQFATDYRVIAVTKNDKLLGFALLEDEIRRDAKEIVNYFYDNNIAVKIISGDNLATVENIAKKVDLKNINGIDLSAIKGTIDYDKLVKSYNIFTRVKPAQKKSLVLALKKHGSTVAMTGDGVNDILAMKEADCSIAIGEGSDAARRSAKLILLKSDFSAVPSIIDEGRQSINNLERSTTLFLSKTVYASILAILFTVIPIEYPYAPIEMSLLNFACIGFPGLILALEHNTARIKNSFTKNILQYSVPIGLTVSIAMLVVATVAELKDFSRPELITISLFVTFAIDLMLIFWISRPLNLLRTGLIATIIGIVITAFLVSFFRDLLDLTFLSLDGIILTFATIAGSIIMFDAMRRLARHFSRRLLAKYPHLGL